LQPANPFAEPRLVEGQSGASAVAYHPDGGALALGGDDGSLLLVDRFTATEQARAERHIYAVHAVAYSADGSALASADTSGVVRVWAADTLQERAVLQAGGLPLALALSPDGSAVAA